VNRKMRTLLGIGVIVGWIITGYFLGALLPGWSSFLVGVVATAVWFIGLPVVWLGYEVMFARLSPTLSSEGGSPPVAGARSKSGLVDLSAILIYEAQRLPFDWSGKVGADLGLAEHMALFMGERYESALFLFNLFSFGEVAARFGEDGAFMRRIMIDASSDVVRSIRRGREGHQAAHGDVEQFVADTWTEYETLTPEGKSEAEAWRFYDAAVKRVFDVETDEVLGLHGLLLAHHIIAQGKAWGVITKAIGAPEGKASRVKAGA
jgi:hypothetical protein